jgi:hypothetical protein
MKLIIGVLLIVLGIFSPSLTEVAVARHNLPAPETSARVEHVIYLPLSLRGHITIHPIMTGNYPDGGWWQPNPQNVIDSQFRPQDEWAESSMSLAGVFHNIQTPAEHLIVMLLGAIWDNGYMPFVNLYANVSAYSIAHGQIDNEIRAWADFYRQYSQNGQRKAFLAPLQEMNGDWVPYGMDPTNYQAAYRRIRDIFLQRGVPPGSVYWVFAPNGWSRPGTPGFEAYYPGHDVVDVVGFSSYNFGYNPNNPFKSWETAPELFGPYIERIQVMAPGKPIMVAQTATTAYTSQGYDVPAKNAWLQDTFTYLAEQPDVIGVVYYNHEDTVQGYEWLYYRAGQVEYYTGYRLAMTHARHLYVHPNEIDQFYFPNRQ